MQQQSVDSTIRLMGGGMPLEASTQPMGDFSLHVLQRISLCGLQPGQPHRTLCSCHQHPLLSHPLPSHSHGAPRTS